MEKDVAVLILGANEGSYAACRSFYTEFGIQPTVLDSQIPPLLRTSRFLRARAVSSFDLAFPSLCLRILEDEREALGKRVLLLPATPAYADFLLKEEAHLSPLFLLPLGKAPSLPYGEGTGLPTGRLFAFLDTRTARYCYAETPLYCGERPAFYRTKSLPLSLLSFCEGLKEKAKGIFTFPVWEKEGDFLIGAPSSDLSSLPFFATAADVSPAELLLFCHVLCAAPSEASFAPDGVYRILPRRQILRLLKNSEVRADFLSLCKRGWEIGLLDGKGEGLSPKGFFARRRAARDYGAES